MADNLGGPKKDFRVFLFLCWQYLKLPKPTRAQYALAARLQNGPRRDVIQAFRGVGKSWVTVAFVLWRLWNDPKMNVEVVSASKNLADNFSTFAFQLIKSWEVIQDLRPDRFGRDSKIEFDVGGAGSSRDPSVKSVGIFGALTGTRADLIIPDDVETPNTSETVGLREKLKNAVSEFDAIVKPNGCIKYLGTPQNQETLYKVLYQERQYGCWIWPARYPTKKQWENYGPHLAAELHGDLKRYQEEEGVSRDDAIEALEGRPTDNERFDDQDLMEREASYGRSGFQLQFMLDSAPSDETRYPLKLSDLIVTPLDIDLAPEKLVYTSDPRNAYGDELHNYGFNGDRFYRPMETLGDHVPYTDSILFVDPSGKGKDETAVATVKTLNSYIFVPEVRGLQGGYSEAVMHSIKEMAYRHKVTKILIETNFGDGMFTALLKPHLGRETASTDGRPIPPYPVAIEEVRATRQKELRIIDTLEPVMNSHRLVVDPKVIMDDYNSLKDYPTDTRMYYSLFYQLTHCTNEPGSLRQDDRLDALAQAVRYFVDMMSLDEDKMKEQRQNRLLAEELRRFCRTQIHDGGYLTNRTNRRGRSSLPVLRT